MQCINDKTECFCYKNLHRTALHTLNSSFCFAHLATTAFDLVENDDLLQGSSKIQVLDDLHFKLDASQPAQRHFLCYTYIHMSNERGLYKYSLLIADEFASVTVN